MKLFKKITSADHKIKFPAGIDKGAKSLLRHLLVRDVSQRYGCMKNGIKDITQHRFFASIDWDQMRSRMAADIPFVPKIGGESDTKNFARYKEEDSNVTTAKCPKLSPKSDPFLSW